MKKNIMVLACSLRAQAILLQQGVQYQTTLPYFGRKGHESCLAASNVLINAIRQRLRLGELERIERGYVNTFIFHLRRLIHYLLFSVEVLHQAFQIIEPGKIITVAQKNQIVPWYLSFDEKNIWQSIVSQFSDKHAVVFEHIPTDKLCKKKALSQRIKAVLKNEVRSLAFFLNLFLYEKLSLNRKYLLCVSMDYNMVDVVTAFQNAYDDVGVACLNNSNYLKDMLCSFKSRGRFLNFLSLPVSLSAGEKKDFLHSLNKDILNVIGLLSDKQGIATYRAVDLSSLIISYMEQSLVPILLEQYGRTLNLNKLLDRSHPALVLSQYAINSSDDLGALCDKKKIPALMISHGSHVPPKNEFETIEWQEHGRGLMNTQYPYVALQSPWAHKYLSVLPCDSTLLKTGPLLFGKKIDASKNKTDLRRRILPSMENKHILLHAGTPKYSSSSRFYVYETADEYINNIIELIGAVEKIENAYLIVRFRPDSNLSTQDLSRLLPHSDCYSIHSQGAFSDYLLLSDLLISYSSTTIEEALQNKIPVLQYDPQGKYQHIPGEVLKTENEIAVNSCYFIGNQKDLKRGISWIIDHHLTKQKDLEDIWQRHRFPEEKLIDLPAFFADRFQA
nr:hypothetical protein [uncultured Desulfobacter sp.]